MWLYLFFISLGVFFGYFNLLPQKFKALSTTMQMFCLLVMLFIMGFKIGLDDSIIKNFGVIGIKSLVLSVAAIAGSIILVRLVSPLIIGLTKTDERKSKNVV